MRSAIIIITLLLIGNLNAKPAAQNIITESQNVSVAGKSILLKISIDITDHKKLAPLVPKIVRQYFNDWPDLVKLLDAPTNQIPHHLTVKFKQQMGHPAHVAGTTMVIEIQHITRHPDDLSGLFTHELTHFVQNYPPGVPAWFTEGAADYTRYKIHPKSKWATNNKARTDKSKPKGQYWNSTAFLLWIEETSQKSITKIISRACKNGKYHENLWKKHTGKPLDQLIREYKKS